MKARDATWPIGLGLAVAGLLVGCAETYHYRLEYRPKYQAYAGAPLPREQVAILVCVLAEGTRQGYVPPNVERVDGGKFLAVNYRSVELLPGDHDIDFNSGFSGSTIRKHVTVEAGKTYTARVTTFGWHTERFQNRPYSAGSWSLEVTEAPPGYEW